MLVVLRFVATLAALAIAVSVGAGILTGNRHYFKFAWRVFLFALALAVGFFVVLLLERLSLAI
jgi:hypothetical protein